MLNRREVLTLLPVAMTAFLPRVDEVDKVDSRAELCYELASENQGEIAARFISRGNDYFRDEMNAS